MEIFREITLDGQVLSLLLLDDAIAFKGIEQCRS